MRDWLLYLVIAGALVFAVSSWWGVRRLKAKHTRSAVWEETHNPGLGRQKVAVVLNPIKSRSAEARVLVESACLAAGWEAPRFFETTAEDPGFSQARAAVEYGADVVLVGGGDGTVRVVADVLAHTDIAMGLLPLGTGKDAEVVGDTNDGLKKAVGWLAYTEAGVRHLPGRRKRVAISLDDQPEQSRKIRSVLFANCGLIPGGIDFIPQAMIDGGMLDVVVMSPRSAIGWLAMYWKIVLKHKRNLPVMTYYRSGKIVIKCAEPMPTQVDGDPSGEATTVTVQVAPGSLLVRVKEGVGREDTP